MKGIITVIGKDKKGIIAGITAILSKNDVNVLDISQTIMQGNFTMIMLADFSDLKIQFNQIIDELEKEGKELKVSVKVQREEIFDAMHNI